MEKYLPMAEDKAEVYYSLGNLFRAKGDNKQASHYFKEAVKIRINHEDALFQLAMITEEEGSFDEILQFYQEFIDQDPYSAGAWYNLGVVYNRLGRFEDAIKAYDYAILIDDSFASAYFNLGNALKSPTVRKRDGVRCIFFDRISILNKSNQGLTIAQYRIKYRTRGNLKSTQG